MKKILKVKNDFNLFIFLLSIIITLGIGYLSSSFIRGYGEMYNNLIRPVFAPPSWIFPVVWTILYIMMGIAVYRIWMVGKGECVRKALVLYFIQLVFNFLWPLIFFRFRLRAIAFLEIILLIIFIALTTAEFYKKDKISGNLMLPYLVWCIFAVVLNYSIWLLNA
jgi:tryptophan-rich sensory protein